MEELIQTWVLIVLMIGKHLKQEAQSAEIADLNNQLKGMMKLLEKSIGKKGVDEVWANQQIENSGTRFNEVSGSFATINHGKSAQETSYALQTRDITKKVTWK